MKGENAQPQKKNRHPNILGLAQTHFLQKKYRKAPSTWQTPMAARVEFHFFGNVARGLTTARGLAMARGLATLAPGLVKPGLLW